MKIISWNVNGLRSIYAKGLLEFLNNEKPDILCLQEIKISPEHLEEMPDLASFGKWHISSAEKKGYSGVATCISPNVKLLDKPLRNISSTTADPEGRFIITSHPGFTLYNVYFPSGTSGEHRQNFKYTFLERFYKHLSSLPKQKRDKLIICGDINICHKEVDIHHPEIATKRKLTGFLPEERKWMDRFCELGFVDTYRHIHGDKKQEYTWWSFRANSRAKNLGWRIDYIFVSSALKNSIKNAEILNKQTGSDHCPIVLEI